MTLVFEFLRGRFNGHEQFALADATAQGQKAMSLFFSKQL